VDLKAVAYIDYENIWRGLVERGYKLTTEEFIELIERYANSIKVDIKAVYLYANFDIEEFWRSQTVFEKKGFYTRHVYGKNNYANTEIRRNAADLELMMEAQETLLHRFSSFDLFLIFTGDGDFFPLVRKIRAFGKEVKIIGVNGKTNKLLQPFCEGLDILCSLANKESKVNYNPVNNLEEGIGIISNLQISLPYVASTRARVIISRKTGCPLTDIKELINYMLNENIIFEREYPDQNLKIKKTKIYLLNLKHPLVIKVIGDRICELSERYSKIQEKFT